MSLLDKVKGAAVVDTPTASGKDAVPAEVIDYIAATLTDAPADGTKTFGPVEAANKNSAANIAYRVRVTLKDRDIYTSTRVKLDEAMTKEVPKDHKGPVFWGLVKVSADKYVIRSSGTGDDA